MAHSLGLRQAVDSRSNHAGNLLHIGAASHTVCLPARKSDTKRWSPLRCPFCQNGDTRVIDTRVTDEGSTIRRRRECTKCKRRFTTLETSGFSVRKRSGAVEPFSREKITAGVSKACQGRPVHDHDLALLAQQVEESLRVTGQPVVSASAVGKAILPHLRKLDQVAYLRFASVYSSFETLDDFRAAIEDLETQDNPVLPDS